MRTIFRFLVPSVCLLLGAAVVFGQGITTAQLTGTVMHEGAPLPGVTVTVSSPSLQGTRTRATGENGGYIFPQLPPGKYEVTFEMQGMQTVTQNAVLELAQTTKVDATMRLSAVAEAITVTAAAPAVLEAPQIARTFTRAEMDKIPITRTIASMVSLAPGVNSGIAGNSISGAASSENVYLINGVAVNENLRGQPHNLFIEDAIQETTVITGGISAEYGRFTGGVINTITKSGGNVFSGSLRDSVDNPKWRRKTPWPDEADHVDELSEFYEATLGGYILRDRLWFFAAGRSVEASDQRFTTQTNIPFVFGSEETRLEGKLTAQITPRHSLVGSYIDVDSVQKNNRFGAILDLASLDRERSLPNTLGSLIYNGVLTSNLFVEANIGSKEFAFVGSGSDFRDRVFGTLMIDLATGRRYWSPTFCGVCTDEERNNDQWLAKATYYISSRSLGNHSIVGGIENYSETRIANNHQSGSDFRITTPTRIVNNTPFPHFDSRSRINWTPILRSSEGTDFVTDSVYVNDRWELNNNWSFNVGLRFDKNDGHDADGNTVSDDSELSPRLGLQYDVFGDGRHRFNMNYGRYVAKIADGNVGGSAQSAGNPGFISFRYEGPEINGLAVPDSQLLTTDKVLEMVWAWFDSVGGTNNRDIMDSASVPGFSTRFEGSISSPAADEITFGYGTQIGRTGFVRADLVHREWTNFYAARLTDTSKRTTDPFGNLSDFTITVNNDEFTEREYQAIQLQGGWRPGRFTLGGSYTYSELEGNDDTESGPSATVRSTPGQIFYPEYLDYPQRRPVGRLSEDTNHRARVWASYDIPFPLGELSLAVLQSFDSGSPYSAAGSIDASGRAAGNAFAGRPTNPGYVLNLLGTSHTYFFSERGAFETDDFHRTDLALNYSVPIWKVRLFVQGQIINLFDNDNVLNPDDTVRTRRSAGAASGLVAFNPRTTTPIECPQGAPSSQCRDMGAHWQKGPNFGKPIGVSSYQLPFEYKFSAGIRF